MIKNHPFQNGNKRMAIMTLLYYLCKNNKWLKVNIKSLYTFAVAVASSPSLAKKEILNYIKKFIELHLIFFKK